MKIGLQFAMPAEFHALPGAKEQEAFETVSGVPFYEAAPGIIACAGGVSKVNAAMAAEILCLKYGVDMIVNAGVAGCLTELPTGSLVVAEDFVQHDVDTSPLGDPPGMVSGPDMVHFPCDGALRALLDKAGAAAGLTVWHGAVATGDQFIAAEEQQDFLRRYYGAAACDMEGGAIAQTCYEMGVPYAACRAISDTRRGDGREYMEKARIACLREQALVRAFMALYAENGRHEHG